MLFTILKTILFIILILLLIILLLILIILLSKLKYSVAGGYDEKPHYAVHLSYLLGIVKIDLDSADGLNLRIFGFGGKKKEKTDSTDTPSEDETEQTPDDTESSTVQATTVPEQPPALPDLDDAVPELTKPPAESKKPKAKRKKAKKAKPDKVKRPRSAKAPKKSFIDKIKDTRDKFNDIKQRYDWAAIFVLFKKYLKEQIKAIGIKGASVHGVLGTGDPAQTGAALGGIAAAQAFLPLKIDMHGDFEKKNINIEGELHGRTCLLKLGLPALKFILKKPVFAIIKDLIFKKRPKKQVSQ